MICRMRIKLGVTFWKILYDWVQNLLRQIYFVSFTLKKKNEFHFLYLWVYLWNLLIWLKCEYLMWDSIWCIFLLLVLLCVFNFWSFGYVKDSVLRFSFLIVGSFMVLYGALIFCCFWFYKSDSAKLWFCASWFECIVRVLISWWVKVIWKT